MEEQIVKIIEIGKKDYCTEEDFKYVLPDYPSINEKQFIFTHKCSAAASALGDDIGYYIKGLHLIELKYRSKTNDRFGFGCLSKTYSTVLKLYQTNPMLSDELGRWVAYNGGNYNIYDCSEGREYVPNW